MTNQRAPHVHTHWMGHEIIISLFKVTINVYSYTFPLRSPDGHKETDSLVGALGGRRGGGMIYLVVAKLRLEFSFPDSPGSSLSLTCHFNRIQ